MEYGIDIAETCPSIGEQDLICDYSKLDPPKIQRERFDAKAEETSRSWADKPEALKDSGFKKSSRTRLNASNWCSKVILSILIMACTT